MAYVRAAVAAYLLCVALAAAVAAFVVTTPRTRSDALSRARPIPEHTIAASASVLRRRRSSHEAH